MADFLYLYIAYVHQGGNKYICSHLTITEYNQNNLCSVVLRFEIRMWQFDCYRIFQIARFIQVLFTLVCLIIDYQFWKNFAPKKCVLGPGRLLFQEFFFAAFNLIYGKNCYSESNESHMLNAYVQCRHFNQTIGNREKNSKDDY